MVLPILPLQAQTNVEDGFRQIAEVFFSPLRENVHLHLNKTIFFKGESLWFTAYVYDQSRGKPSAQSTNLHVGLYDVEGNEITRKLVLLEGGVGIGDFDLGEELTDNTYVLRAWTSHMRNFEDLREYEQLIRVGSAPSPNDSIVENPEIHIAAEGGQIIRNALNVVGFHLKYASAANVTQVELIDNRGQVLLSNLGISSRGLGKVSYLHRGKSTYSLRITFQNRTRLTQPLPEARDQGVLVQIPRVSKGDLPIVLSTNNKTLREVKESVWFLAIHQNQRITVEEVTLDSTINRILLPAQSLYEGVNTITLFDASLEPISERLVFRKEGRLGIQNYFSLQAEPEADQDSITLSVEPISTLDSRTAISISVLPGESLADLSLHSIRTAFLLRPFSGYPQVNWRELFESNEDDLIHEIDAVMLLSGSGVYNWQRLKRGIQDLKFDFEHLISLEGALVDSDPARENLGWFFTQNTKNGFFLELDGRKSFRSEQILFEGDSLNISLLNHQGKLRKPKAEDVHFKNGVNPRTISPYLEGISDSFKNETNEAGLRSTPLDMGERTIKLEEVVVEEKLNKSKDLPILDARFSGRIVSDRDVKSKGMLQNYLISLGYRAVTFNGQVFFQKGSPITNAPAAVTINGMPDTGMGILNYPLLLVESVVTYNSKYSSFISVQTSGRRVNELKKEYVAILVKRGFTPTRQYESALYSSLEGAAYRNYGAVHWEPLLFLNAEGPLRISFPANRQHGLRVRIEGLSTDGSLISETHLLSGYK